MKYIDIKLDNFDELKKELLLDWELFDNLNCSRPNNPYWIKIYDLLNVDSGFSQLEITKNYLKKYNLVNFQIVIYLPYANTGFHIDGNVNRYLIPIKSSDDAINFELDEFYLTKSEVIPYFQNKVRWNEPPHQIHHGFDWINQQNKNNKMFVIKEGECIEIGKNWHAHINNHFNHRIVLVFDTKEPINL